MSGSENAISMVYILSKVSENYLKKAHEIIHLSVKDKTYLQQYQQLVYASIKALTSAVTKLNDYPITTQISIHLKLAQLYHDETETKSDHCDTNLNKALTIAKRVNSLDLQFQVEFFAAKLISSSNDKVALKYLNLKISEFSSLGYIQWVSIYRLLKIQLYLKNDVKMALVELAQFNNDSQVAKTLRLYGSLIECNVWLSMASLDKPKIILERIKPEMEDAIVQIKAMYLLNDLQLSINSNSAFSEIKQKISLVNNFVESQISGENLSIWPSNGVFCITLPLPLNGDETWDFELRVDWLSIEEVQILLWLQSGIAYLPKFYNQDTGAECLSTAMKLCDKLENKLNTKGFTRRHKDDTLQLFKSKSQSLTDIKYQIEYFTKFHDFLKNPNDFRIFTEDEFEFNSGIYWKYKFLEALALQQKNEIQKSKVVYEQLAAQKVNTELRLYSFLSLLFILEAMISDSEDSTQIEVLAKQRNKLLQELELSKYNKPLFNKTKTLLNVTLNQLSYKDILDNLKQICDSPLTSEIAPELSALAGVYIAENSIDHQTKSYYLLRCCALSKLANNIALERFSQEEIKKMKT